MIRKIYQRYGLAIVALGLATLVRLVLNPWLEGYQPFFPYYGVTLFVCWYAGFRPAILTAVVGAVLAQFLFMQPQHSFAVKDWRDLLELVIYACISLLSIALIRMSQRRTELARRRQLALEQEMQQRNIAEMALRNANSELLRIKNELERANRAKDEFLAVCGHELRTPLTPILGWSALLRSGDLDEARRQHGLDVIERNIRQQQRLIEDLLDISRITAGKIQLEKQRLKPSNIIEAAVETVCDLARRKEISITTILRDAGGLEIIGDPVRLQQIVCNLLTNAIKFTPNKGQIEVQLARSNANVELSVTDTGEGIGADFIPRLFDRFSQAETGSARKHGGLGLGLAIVRRLVEMHGGTVRAESPGKGKGSKFTISLPIAEESRATIGDVTESGQAETSLKGIRVLAIDDEADCREFVAAALTPCGAQVTTVESAAQALNIFESVKPDIVIADIGMPEQDGHVLIQKLKALEKLSGHVAPAIALTAYADSDTRAQVLSEGYCAHIAKPVQPSSLIKIVLDLCSSVHVAP